MIRFKITMVATEVTDIVYEIKSEDAHKDFSNNK